MNSIAEIAKFLKKKGEKLRPLYFEQIKAIETKYAIQLPKVYKEFLSLMGESAGNYMLGTSVFYDELLSLQEWTYELIEENSLPPLPPNSFVFWMHQGYQAAYFRTVEGDDPPVYFFSEGMKENKFILMTYSLTDFFIMQLKISFSEDNIILPQMPG